MAQLITQLTLTILTAAAIVFLLQVSRQMAGGRRSASGFPTILLVTLTGWIATEVIEDVAGDILGEAGRISHFAVMAIFAVTITLQLRSSEK